MEQENEPSPSDYPQDSMDVSQPQTKNHNSSDESDELRWTETGDESDSGESDATESEGGEGGVDDTVHKRKRESTERPGASVIALRRFKRQKGVFNHDYLDILNRDIDDAAHQVCLEDKIDVSGSQIGLTYWTSMEKHLFFEALSKMGRHDLPGIASRIGTKDAVEVRHYISFLEEALKTYWKPRKRVFVEPADYPAAIELSQQCCFAQDETADIISYRQELREERREKNKWGDNWKITPQLAKSIDKQQKQPGYKGPPFSDFFHLSRWLNISYRAFMNSSITSSNWNYIDDEPPSIWATTLDDFHALAVSLTKRLVQTTLFMSASRIKSKSRLHRTTQQVVRKRDVEAAIATLAMSRNSWEFWKKSARRLRLEVYHNAPEREDCSDGEEAMGYDEVERKLSSKNEELSPPSSPKRAEIVERDEGSEYELSSLASSDEEDISGSEADEAQLVNLEAKEILKYGVATLPAGQRAAAALQQRLRAERAQDAAADVADLRANVQAEHDMWAILKVGPQAPQPRPPSYRDQTEKVWEDVENIYPMRSDWTRDLSYHSEWESERGAVP